jgi:predicted glutamine amidotransferase
VIAHIRKATQGRVALENTHPFVRELWGRYWVFAHNGDLKDFAPRLHGAFRPVGDTDSERAFCWLMQELAKAHAGVPTRRRADAHAARAAAAAWHAHGSFNLLLSNGRRCGRMLHQAALAAAPAPVRRRRAGRRGPERRLRALTTPDDRVAVVATEPLTTRRGLAGFRARRAEGLRRR